PDFATYLYRDYVVLVDIQLALKDHQGAAATAEKMPERNKDSYIECLDAARCLLRCALPALEDTKRAKDERDRLADDYEGRAVRQLQEAVRRGYKAVEVLKTAPEYAPIRQRPDFKKLIRDLEERAGQVTT